MTYPHPDCARAAVLAIATLFGVVPLAQAQAFRSEVLGLPMVVEVQIEASSPEIVPLLAGLSEIRADLQLGLLFLEEGLSHPEGSHFTHPRKTTWPKIKDGLVAAGVADIEPLLVALEAAADKDAVTAAYQEVEAALLQARSTLNPTAEDVLLALLEMTKVAASEISPSGPTPVYDYQSAWSIVMAARGELDLLARHEDPAIAKLAAEEAMAFDDLIISMPDPHQSAPVEFDVTLITDLIARLEKLNQAA